MNENQIENLLRKAPRLNVPKNLKGKLREAIHLPHVASSQNVEKTIWFLWKRWLPAAICLVFALTAFGVQFRALDRLKKENARLQSATGDLEHLRRDNAEYKRLMLAGADAERMRKNHGELLKLEAEVGQLRTKTAQLERSHAESRALVTSPVATANTTNDFFAEQQARAERATCINNLKQIGLSARLWSNDNENIYPMNFISMTNELGSPRVMSCPADKARQKLTWADVATGNVSYQMIAPGIKENETGPSVVFAECPIHYNFCLADGSVQGLSKEDIKNSFEVVNGRKVFVR